MLELVEMELAMRRESTDQLWKLKFTWAFSGNSDISTAINELGQLPRPPCILDGLSLPLYCVQPLASHPFPAELPGPATLRTGVKLPLVQQIDTCSRLSASKLLEPWIPFYYNITWGAQSHSPALRWGWDPCIEVTPLQVLYSSLDFHSAHYEVLCFSTSPGYTHQSLKIYYL